jgi:putative PIN family toxin of toxin-antitoxin system
VSSVILAIVVDTNLWISALINLHGAPARLFDAIRAGQVHLILSRPLLAELRDVLGRARIRRRIPLTDEEIESYLAVIVQKSTMIDVRERFHLCRDPKDDIFIETAIEGGAQYIVSRDEDLTRDLDLVDTLAGLGIEITTVARFLVLLDSQAE